MHSSTGMQGTCTTVYPTGPFEACRSLSVEHVRKGLVVDLYRQYVKINLTVVGRSRHCFDLCTRREQDAVRVGIAASIVDTTMVEDGAHQGRLKRRSKRIAGGLAALVPKHIAKLS